MPRIDPGEHVAAPLRVHALAKDFELLDVWEYPIRARAPHDLSYFIAFSRRVQTEMVAGSGAAAWLFRLRAAMGRAFGWDDKPKPLAIPGCEETTVRARLDPPEHGVEPGPADAMGFALVYELPDEVLYELSNSTVHALMHLEWVDKSDDTHAPRMAVYVKPRGWFGRCYMALIAPFRHLIVYPALMRKMSRAWSAAHTR